MAKLIKKAGRPARVPAAKLPPRTPGVTGGKMRSRTDADKPWNPSGAAAKPKAQKPAKPQGKRGS